MSDPRRIKGAQGRLEAALAPVQRVVVRPCEKVEAGPLEFAQHGGVGRDPGAAALSGGVALELVQEHLEVGEPDIGALDEIDHPDKGGFTEHGQPLCDQCVACCCEAEPAFDWVVHVRPSNSNHQLTFDGRIG